MKARLKDRKLVARGTMEVDFDMDGEKYEFKPGQYLSINLINPPYNDAEGSHRYFSINNSPTQKGVLIITTRIRNSAFKKSLQEFPLGTEVEIDSIAGDFVLPPQTSQPLVFIAGGIGITPFMSMLRFVKEKSLDYKITLFYSNKTKEVAPFLGELEKMAVSNSQFKFIPTMTQDAKWKGENRHIDARLLGDYLVDPDSNKYFIAGPPGLVKTMFQALLKIGVNSANIKTENFDGY